MHVVRRALDVATTVTAWIGGLAATAMMLHVTADVIGRTFFNRPLTGTVDGDSGRCVDVARRVPAQSKNFRHKFRVVNRWYRVGHH